MTQTRQTHIYLHKARAHPKTPYLCKTKNGDPKINSCVNQNLEHEGTF